MERLFGELAKNMMPGDPEYFQQVIMVLNMQKIRSVVLLINTITGSLMEYDLDTDTPIRYEPFVGKKK